MKIVEIEWIDSKGITSDWEFKDDIKSLEPCLCKSVGYLLDDNENYKTIVQSDSSEQVLGRLTIPKESIKKLKTLNTNPKG
jgi:hypothetical protein